MEALEARSVGARVYGASGVWRQVVCCCAVVGRPPIRVFGIKKGIPCNNVVTRFESDEIK